MLPDLTDVLGGWKSCKRTFLSVLGVPFPPTTCEQNIAHSFTDIAAIVNGCALNKIKQDTQGGNTYIMGEKIWSWFNFSNQVYFNILFVSEKKR